MDRRDCLKCGKSFLSTGTGNRLCRVCNKLNATHSRLATQAPVKKPTMPKIGIELEVETG